MLRFSFVVTLGVCPPAAAQEALTLDQAINGVLAQNPSVRAAEAGSRAASEQVVVARSAYFPRVGASDSWQRGNQPVFVFGSLLSSRQFTSANFAVDALNHPEATGYFHGLFGVEQLVWDGGRTRADVRAATWQRDAADAAVAQTRAELVVAATGAYGHVLIAESEQRSAEAAVAAAQEDLSRAERRRDIGTVTEADVLALSVHMAQMRQRAIQAAADAAIARGTLNRLMGAPLDREYRVAEPPPASSPDASNLTALDAEAVHGRPELRRAAAEERAAGAARDAARAAWQPQVTVQGAYELDGLRFGDRASAWLVGAEIRWSLSTGGAERARVKAAAESMARAKAEREQATSQVQLELLSAVRRLDAARARDAVGRATVAQATESQRIIRDRYEAGLASVNDVLRAASMALEAEGQRVAAVVDVMTADAAFRRAIGRMP